MLARKSRSLCREPYEDGEGIMTSEEIKAALDNLDLKIRPQMLVLHPLLLNQVKDLIPELFERFVICPTESVDVDKAYLIDRKYLNFGH